VPTQRYDNAGRKNCGDPFTILTVLALMPYALIRYGVDRRRERRR
jgi:hypothetical protein